MVYYSDNFIHWGFYGVSKFQEILFSNDFDWNEWRTREKKYPLLYQVSTIPLLFDETLEFKNKQEHKHYNLFKSELINLENFSKDLFNEDGYILNAMIVKLNSMSQIKPHTDSGLKFHTKIFRRIHLPIFTNDKCIFTCGDEKQNFKIGELWTPNYTEKFHSVVNDGETDRINLMFDWKKPPLDSEGS